MNSKNGNSSSNLCRFLEMQIVSFLYIFTLLELLVGIVLFTLI